MRFIVSLAFTFFVSFGANNLQAQTVLNCILNITSLETKYLPLIGFEGNKTVGVLVTIYRDNKIQVSGLLHVDAIYQPVRVTEDGIYFSGIRTFSDERVQRHYGSKIISGSLNRYSGLFSIYTPEKENRGSITFGGEGYCTKVNRLL